MPHENRWDALDRAGRAAAVLGGIAVVADHWTGGVLLFAVGGVFGVGGAAASVWFRVGAP